MDWKQKYLKYKNKYLNLKALKNNKQTGGSLNNIDHLSTTPSMTETYGYRLKGGHITNQITNQINNQITNYDRLVKLIADSDANQLAGSDGSDNVDSDDEQLAGSDGSDNMDSNDEQLAGSDGSDNMDSDDDQLAGSNGSDNVDSNAMSTIDQEGGMKKAKSNKKYFFEDSDLNLDTSTSNSGLSLMDSDSDDSNEYNL